MELTLGEPWQFLLDQWLEAIDEFDVKIKRAQRKIETMAKKLDEMDYLILAPEIAAYSGLMIHSEIGSIDRTR